MYDTLYLFGALGLHLLAVGAGGWAVINQVRRERAVTRGALGAAVTLGLACVATDTGFLPWIEGGWPMALVAMVGAYAIGSAVAARGTPTRAPRYAALGALGLAANIALLGRFSMMVDIERAVSHAPLQDRAIILELSSAEAWRPVQLAGLLAVVVFAMLMKRPGSPQRALSGERVSPLDAASVREGLRARFSLRAAGQASSGS